MFEKFENIANRPIDVLREVLEGVESISLLVAGCNALRVRHEAMILITAH